MGGVTMNEIMLLVPPLLAGMLLGAIFFGGLWWTVLKGISARQPALWFGLSMLARTCIVLAGFYFVADSDWKRLLLCLSGFVIARFVVTRMTKVWMPKEVSHAP
jgi:F1F0 ATPase subunit 2